MGAGSVVVGWALIAGLVVFLTGAVAWRLAYEQPLTEALHVIHGDRRRRAWIHLWMIPAVFLTSGGVAAVVPLFDSPTAAALGGMAAAVYVAGAVCWIASLAFRLTVVPWAAEQTVATGRPPDGFEALNAWAGSLFVVHMAAAYAAFVILGAAVLAAGQLPVWLGWTGVGWGAAFLAGLAVTRAAGPFSPPFWAHAYTGIVGIVLVTT